MADAPAAARVGDPVTHSAALFGLLEGALVGAALGAILVASGGTAAPLVIAGAMATGTSLGGTVGKLWGTHHVTPCGTVLTGSPDVFVDGKPAAFVGSLVSCRQHPGPQTVVEGSGSVEINGRRSARVGDRCSCGCVIAPPGSSDTVVGGPAMMPEGAAAAEVPWYADATLFVLGLAGGGALMAAKGLGALAIAARLGGSVVGGTAGGVAGQVSGGGLFGEGTVGQDMMALGGALVGGGLGYRVGARLVGAPRATPPEVNVIDRVRAVADASPRPPRGTDPTTVAVMATREGTVYEGGSGFLRRSEFTRAVPPSVQRALDDVPPDMRRPFHGTCAEIDAVSQAVDAGENVAGSRIATARVRGPTSPAHGTPIEPCPSCQHVLGQFGIGYQQGP